MSSVIGHQFWWEFRYPKLGIVTANELHIPVSDPHHPTPTYLELSSADTDHSFWVPQLAGKTDVIPNRVNAMWIDRREAGSLPGAVRAILRGAARQNADSRVRAVAGGLQRVGRATAAAGEPGRICRRGAKRCFCATLASIVIPISGTAATGRFGPDLTHLASRDTIASGAIQNTPANLRKWIDNPDQMKPGCLMPAMHLNDHDLTAVTAYLTTLH